MPATYLTQSEVELLEANALTWSTQAGQMEPCLRDQLLIRILARTGCRVSEAVALSLDDVDLIGGALRIIRQKDRVQLYCPHCSTRIARSHAHCPGCGQSIPEPVRRLQEARRQRLLFLDSSTLHMVQEYIDRGGPIEKDGKMMLFGFGRHRACQIINNAAIRAGLGPLVNAETGRQHHVSPHRLRDAFATLAISKDSSAEGLKLLQEQLGHISFDTTAKYVKLQEGRRREWLGSLFSDVVE